MAAADTRPLHETHASMASTHRRLPLPTVNPSGTGGGGGGAAALLACSWLSLKHVSITAIASSSFSTKGAQQCQAVEQFLWNSLVLSQRCDEVSHS